MHTQNVFIAFLYVKRSLQGFLLHSEFNIAILCYSTIQNITFYIRNYLLLNFIQVVHDEEMDELSTYFKCEVRPKVLLTTSNKPSVVCVNNVHT